jgi:cytochrome c
MRNLSLSFAVLGFKLFCAVGLVGLISVPRVSAQSVEDGQKQFLTSCGVCHTAEAGGPNRQGPNLYGIYNRKAGKNESFKYSEALKKGNWIWNDATLDPWLENSQEAHPGTIMTYRQTNPEKRQLVIDYLKSLSQVK